jgi:capsid protein
MSWGGKRAGAGRKPQPKNRAFEGAEDGYGRTFIYMPCYAPEELGSWDRQRIADKGRWFYNNSGLVARGIDGVARFAIGRGISPQARSKDREWNQLAEMAFEDKCGTAAFGFDTGAQVNFYEAQPLIMKQILTDGDFFGQPMLSQSGAGMMHFIGGEYCRSPFKDKKYRDGVLVDRLGKPVSYQFLTDVEKQTYAEVDAKDIIHFKRIHRHGFVRGVSALCRAVNHLHDMTDILAFTKGSFKLASQIGLVITTAEGGRTGLGGSLERKTINVQTSPGVTGTSSVTHDKMYPLAGHVDLKPGEEIQTLTNSHPGSSFEPFMNYLIRDVSWGLGISPELLWNITTTGGANVRGMFQSDQMMFEELQELLINQFCRRFWVFWLWQEIKNGRLPYPGEDWWKHDWLRPARMTVDFTKDGKLLASLVDQGLLSPERYYGMQGLDAETEEYDVIRRRARRKKMVEEVSAEEGVELTVMECFPPPAGATYAAGIGEQPEEEEEKVDKPKGK